MGFRVSSHIINPKPAHVRFGSFVGPMSALPPKADITQGGCHVRFVPKADI
jgi:hypothetical protein